MAPTLHRSLHFDTLSCIYVEIPMLVFNQRNFFDSEVQPELSGGVQPEERTPVVCVEGRRLIHSATEPDIVTC